jgi:hypothetical protein
MNVKQCISNVGISSSAVNGEETFIDFRGFSVTIKLCRWIDGHVIFLESIYISKSK